MSSELKDMSLEHCLAWAGGINQRLETVYQEICEYEQMFNELIAKEESESDPLKLFELLEVISHLHGEAEAMRSSDRILITKPTDIQVQMDLLQRSVNKLHLEEGQTKPMKSVEGMEE